MFLIPFTCNKKTKTQASKSCVGKKVWSPAVAETNCLHLLWCSQKLPINLWRMLFSLDSFSDSAWDSSPKSFLIVGSQYLKTPCMYEAKGKIITLNVKKNIRRTSLTTSRRENNLTLGFLLKQYLCSIHGSYHKNVPKFIRNVTLQFPWYPNTFSKKCIHSA